MVEIPHSEKLNYTWIPVYSSITLGKALMEDFVVSVFKKTNDGDVAQQH